MFKALGALNSFARTVAQVGLVGLLSVGGYLGYNAWNRREFAERELAKKDAEIRALQEEKENLETRLRLLKVDHRIARIDVIDQARDSSGRIKTILDFVELNEQGDPLHKAKRFELDGEKIWIEAWVVKFKDEYVEAGDPLRGKSIYWLKGIFSENQPPAKAFSLDEPGQPPAPYRDGDVMSSLERKIWTNFWDFANDPEKIKAIGARTVSGSGPHHKVVKGATYRLEMRSSGDLSIVPEEKPVGTPL